jgi:RHS repeat-associated protein
MTWHLTSRRASWRSLLLATVVSVAVLPEARAYQFKLGDVTVNLQEVTTNVDVYYSAMRFNRAANEWDVDVTVSNKSALTISAPLVYLVDSFTGTSGPLRADGVSTNLSYYDLSGQIPSGVLAPGTVSAARTLGFGFTTNQGPKLATRLFSGIQTNTSQALAFVRTLNQAGQPLPGVSVQETGPGGGATNLTDGVFGVATLGQLPGDYVWQFSQPGYLSVWRQASLQSNSVAVIPYPWLTASSQQTFTISPLLGGTASNQTVAVQFGPGSVSQQAAVQLTALGSQTLPLFLPQGWSPLQAFWLQSSVAIRQPVQASLIPWGPISLAENAVLVQFSSAPLGWQALELAPGNDTNAVSVSLPGGGVYALVVADTAPAAPPAASVGSLLQPGNAPSANPTNLQAFGTVTPAASPASLAPALVTADADLTVSNVTGSLPSGTLLKGRVHESYLLNDGTTRVPPFYGNSIMGYQRPGQPQLGVVHAHFPMSPVLLFGSDQLNQAVVQADLFPPGPFTGGVVDTNGGVIANAGLRLLVGAGVVASREAVQLFRVSPTNFTSLAGTNFPVVAAFEVAVGTLPPGGELFLQSTGAPPSTSLVLARVRTDEGLYGLEPRKRLQSDLNGNLLSSEPTNGPALPGLTGSGEYVLLQVQPQQDLVEGIAKNAAGQPAGGLPVQVAGQPWLTFSAPDGSFKLLAPGGSGSLNVSDLATGDTGSQAINVPTNLTSLSTSVAVVAGGPQVVSVAPSDGSTNVAQVSSVVINFNRPINPATLMSNAVQLLESNLPVATTLTLNLANTTVTLLPSAPLDPATQFTLALATNITDTIGRPLQGQSQFSFTTVALSARDPAAQLIIYAPGATNLATNVLAALPGFIPGTNASLIVVHGTSGCADPGVPVIIENEGSGATTTVLSQPDGSFTSYVSGQEQDFISATFISLNGARLYVPVNRQLFDDGTVGLYQQGGTLQALGAGGLVQIVVPPNAVSARTKFKLDPLSTDQLQAQTGGVGPQNATIAGGALHLHIEGQPPSLPMQASFPVDLAALGYPTNQPASNAVLALSLLNTNDAVTSYQVLDQMVFSPESASSDLAKRVRPRAGVRPRDGGGSGFAGTLLTVSGFAPGLVGLVSAAYDFVIAPMFMIGSLPVVVTGQTYYYSAPPPGSASILPVKQAVSGAYIVMGPVPSIVVRQPGVLQPGWVYATSDANGVYRMIAPFASVNYSLTATDPQFQDSQSGIVANLVSTAGAVHNFVFTSPITNQLTPKVTVAASPPYPAAGQTCVIQVTASQAVGGPPPVDVSILSVGQTNLITSNYEPKVRTSLVNTQLVTSGNIEQWTGTLTSDKAVSVVLEVTVQGTKVSVPPTTYAVLFDGAPPPPPPSPIPPSDPTDPYGPVVVSTYPSDQGYLDASGNIVITFNKPISTLVETRLGGITLSGSSSPIQPIVTLSSGQLQLTLEFAGLAPNGLYTLTLSGQSIQDLNGLPLNQTPSTSVANSFTTHFRTPPVMTAPLPGLASGRGAVISGTRLYALDQASQGNYLDTYDISAPNKPVLLSQTQLPGAPRDLVVIPQYRYMLTEHPPPATNDLVVVVGGDLATSIDQTTLQPLAPGQYLWVLNMSDPTSPQVLASPILTYNVGSVVPKVRWAPPWLVYEEFGTDIQQLGLIDLQEMIIGFQSNPQQRLGFGTYPNPGYTTNLDGSYLDAGDTLPLPAYQPAEFYGLDKSYVLQLTSQKILDFAATFQAAWVGVTLTSGQKLDQNGNITSVALPACYRTLAYGGTAINLTDPTNSTLAFAAGAYPRWVSIFTSLSVLYNGVPQSPVLALVSLEPDADGVQKVAVIDITLPQSPQLVNKIPIPTALLGQAIESISLRSDGMLQVAGSQNAVLLNPAYLAQTNVPAGQLPPAIAGLIPSAGATTRSLGATSFGVYGVADNGRGLVVETAPTLNFVNFPLAPNVIEPTALPPDDASLTALTSTLRYVSAIPPARVRAAFTIASDLDPPRPAAHYYVLVNAPGGAGKTIELGLESLTPALRALPNPGKSFAPVRAVSDYTQQQIGQPPRPDCGAPIRSLTAYRMSNNPLSVFYNSYLSRPFVMIYEEVSLTDLVALKTEQDREILWGGSFVRAFIDPGQTTNLTLAPFATPIDANLKLLYPISSALALTLNQSYIPGDNVPPINGLVPMPATFGSVAAHNGEFRTEATDMVLPSPRMPIVIERSIGNQDSYDGPFGMGWDFNYNQRLTVLDPATFPPGLQMPLILRDTLGNSEIAGSQDVLLHSGKGRIIHFRWVSSSMPSEFAQDPLVNGPTFDYQDLASDYYLPEDGVFDLLVRYKDGGFERLTPDGMRYDYSAGGRLEHIVDRYPANHHDLTYDRNGWLTRIDDNSVSGPRWVQFGYYRRASDPDFTAGLDTYTANGFTEGKVFCVTNYAGQDVQFFYDNATLTGRQGVMVDGENGGYQGRCHTYYNYNGCQIVGVAVTANSTPLIDASVGSSANGKPVAQAGTGIGGQLQFQIPLNNSAQNLATLNNVVTLADGSSTSYQFDGRGYPTATTVSGGKGPPATCKTTYTNGLLVSMVYPEGNSKTLTYDTNNPVFRSRGNLLSVTANPGPRGGVGYTEAFSYDPRYNEKSGPQQNANGFVWTYQLTSDGRDVASIQYGNAGTETRTYDGNGQMLSRVDIRGTVTAVTYDGSTGFTTTRSMGDSTYSFAYNSETASLLGKPTTIEPPEGAPINVTYNRNSQRVEVARGSLVEEFAYDEQGRQIYSQEQLGDGQALTTRCVFDAKSFLTTNITDGVAVNGQITSLEYDFTPDPVSRIASIRHPQGTLQTFSYDDRGNVTNMTRGDYVEQYTLDLNNNVTAVAQGGDVVRTTVYDGLDRPITITLKTGSKDQTQTNSYYPGGELQSTTIADPEFGAAAQETYDQIDEVGRTLHKTLAGTTISPTYQYTYAPGSETTVGPRMTSVRTWNTAGYDIGLTDSILNEVLHPDGNGRVTEVDRQEDGATYNDFCAYDEQDNRTSSSDNLGDIYLSQCRAEGSLLSLTNAVGHVTSFSHSVLNELLSLTRQDGMAVQFQLDSTRQPTYQGDPTAGFHSAYDQDFRLTNSTLRNGAATIYSNFDPRRMPQAAAIPGGSITLAYDLQRRLTAKTVNYQATAYQLQQRWDALGRLNVTGYQQDTGAFNTNTYTWDEAGPLLSTSCQQDGANFTVRFAYYDDLTPKSITYPSGVTVNQQRDTSGRLTGVSDANGNIISATAWQGNMQPKTVLLGSAIAIENQFDARGRLTASRATRVTNGVVLAHMRYQYDGVGNLLARQFLHRGGRMDNLFFDTGERLSQAQVGTLPLIEVGFSPPLYGRNYTYDPGGLDFLTSAATTNLGITLPPFASQWSHQDGFLQPQLVDTYARGPADPLGNVRNALLQARPLAGSDSVPVSAALTHNGMGNLILVTRADGAIEENYFQPNGLRYARRVLQGGITQDYRHFVYDDTGRLLEEYDVTGSTPKLISRYYYASADAPEAADLPDPATGTLSRYYFLKDNKESVIAVVDSTGVVLERVWCDPYGQPAIEQRDTNAPALRKVIGGDSGSLLVILSESFLGPLTDPGPGTGIISVPQPTNVVTVTLESTNGSVPVSGTMEWVPTLAGYPPYSVISFSPTGALAGAATLTLNAGAVMDEWGNLCASQTVSMQITGGVGTVYYASQPDLQTGPTRLARSSLGSPFLFQGQYFDYDTGLIYLRARFYDPYSGMFLEPDPLSYRDGVNLYAGFANNPATFRDPTGLNELIQEGMSLVRGSARGEQGAAEAVNLAEGVGRGLEVAEHVRAEGRAGASLANETLTTTTAEGAINAAALDERALALGRAQRAAKIEPSAVLALSEQNLALAARDFYKGRGLNAGSVWGFTKDRLFLVIKEAERVAQAGIKGANNAHQALRLRPMEGYFDVLIHGRPFNVEYGTSLLDARELAQIIAEHPIFKSGRGQNLKIRLFSCETGYIHEGGELQTGLLGPGFAQQLANELGKVVRAPTSKVTVGELGEECFELDRAGFPGRMVEFNPSSR